jgi:hypothetical protein
MSIVLDLKAILEANNASWRINENLLHVTEPPKFRLGGLSEKFVPAREIRALDFRTLLAGPANNPFILDRRIAHGFIQAAAIRPELRVGSIQGLVAGEGAALAGGFALSIDGAGRGSRPYAIKMAARPAGYSPRWRWSRRWCASSTVSGRGVPKAMPTRG